MKRFALLASLACTIAHAQPDFSHLDGYKFRSIGPYRGGRSVAAAGSASRPDEFYFGAVGGGLWKSLNAGVDWAPVTDGFLGSSSVGAVAVAPSNPDIVYIGTGERDIRGNISEGDGVYKSTDAGKTWTRLPLVDSGTISRIEVHPTNPDIAWVAVLGDVYVKRDLKTGKIDANPNRGVYKTTDGGKTWKRTLHRNAVSGAVHVSLDPSDPKVLYAALWEAWRTPYSLNSGGPGSGIYKSIDGGDTWKEISRNKGLPKGMLGKIGIDVSGADPKVVYAIVEAEDGGIFRSQDAGATWELVNDNRNYRQRAWYYTHVIADPKDANTLYVLNVGWARSKDGGKTWQNLGGPHSDRHDLWINPNDPNRMIISDDGGGSVSVDGGRTWTDQDYPTGQFYHVSTDNAFPYRVLGAQQDNSTIRIASRTNGAGITTTDWTGTAGGESGYVSAKPDDPDIVFGGSYGGDLSWTNHRTNISRGVDPWPDNPMGAGAEALTQRFQWTYPIVFSPHDPNLLYTCSQYLLTTTNMGQSWRRISPDLTRNDKRTMGSSGGPITKDNTSVEYYGTIFTVAESPITKGMIWTGSDDGLVHLSSDAGGNWKNVTPKGAPEWGLCSMIEPSPHEPRRAILALDNHENDDRAPYIYVTEDSGATWENRVEGLPKTAFVRAVREDPVRPGLLYAGTEIGLFASWDMGRNWKRMDMGLPLTPVHDLTIKNDDLVLATHGRGFWILDDLSPLRSTPSSGGLVAFGGGTYYRQNWGSSPAGTGANPVGGLHIPVWSATAGKANLEMTGPDGTVFPAREVDLVAGYQRVPLRPQLPSYRPLQGAVFWAAGARPIPGPAGDYQVKLTMGSATQATRVRLAPDPRTGASAADSLAQFKFANEVAKRVTDTTVAVEKIRALRDALTAEAAKQPAAKKDAETLIEKLTTVEDAIHQFRSKSGQDPLNYPIRLNNKLAALLGAILQGDYAPTEQSRAVFADLDGQLKTQLEKLDALVSKDLAAFNAKYKTSIGV